MRLWGCEVLDFAVMQQLIKGLVCLKEMAYSSEYMLC